MAPITLICVLLLCSFALAAVRPTLDEDVARAQLRAEQAVYCWPDAFARLVNSTLEALTLDPADPLVLGRVFDVLARQLVATRPLCQSFGRAVLDAVKRRYPPSANMDLPSEGDLTAYCRAQLEEVGGYNTDYPLPSSDPLVQCVRLGARAAVLFV